MATVPFSFTLCFAMALFTANDPEVRAYALQKQLRAMDLGAELGAKNLRPLGCREGVETMPAAARPKPSSASRSRDFLCEYNVDCATNIRFRHGIETDTNPRRYLHGPNRPLPWIYPTLDHPEMVGVNPEVAHEQMAGTKFSCTV